MEKLELRREKHKLTQFYKILNNLTPEYLSELLPPFHSQLHGYNTRNAHNIVVQQCRTSYLQNSFFPSTIRLWNNLPQDIKDSNNLNTFKKALTSFYHNNKIPKYYNIGTRQGQIFHARLRMRCSTLKQHLYLRNLDLDPYCTCGEIESTAHYLLYCPNYTDLRVDLTSSLQTHVTSQILLFGDETKSYAFNCELFLCVQRFILRTRRFTWCNKQTSTSHSRILLGPNFQFSFFEIRQKLAYYMCTCMRIMWLFLINFFSNIHIRLFFSFLLSFLFPYYSYILLDIYLSLNYVTLYLQPTYDWLTLPM